MITGAHIKPFLFEIHPSGLCKKLNFICAQMIKESGQFRVFLIFPAPARGLLLSLKFLFGFLRAGKERLSSSPPRSPFECAMYVCIQEIPSLDGE